MSGNESKRELGARIVQVARAHSWVGASLSESYCSRCGRDARDGASAECIPTKAIKCKLDFDAAAPPSEGEKERSGCPCTIVTPCRSSCTCANSVMSGGCDRCALYGSEGQRRAHAHYLASIIEGHHARPKIEASRAAPSPVQGGGETTLTAEQRAACALVSYPLAKEWGYTELRERVAEVIRDAEAAARRAMLDQVLAVVQSDPWESEKDLVPKLHELLPTAKECRDDYHP